MTRGQIMTKKIIDVNIKNHIDVAIIDAYLPQSFKNSLNEHLVNSYGAPKSNHEICETVQKQIRRWSTRQILLLIFTAGIYGLIFLARNRYTLTPYIFKILAEAKKIELKISSFSTIFDKQHRYSSNIKPVYNNSEDDRSFSDSEYATYLKPTATSTGIKTAQKKSRDIGIRFAENIRQFHRLRNGNIIIQTYNNTVQIVNSRGDSIRTLETNNTPEIMAFSELDNGDIIAIGKDNTTNDAILIEWGQKKRETVFPNTGKITSFDIVANIIAFTTENSYLIQVDLSTKTPKTIQHKLEIPGKIILPTRNFYILYAEENHALQLMNKQLQVMKTQYLPNKITHATRAPSGQFIVATGIKKSELAIWHAHSFIEISTAETVEEHTLPISLLTTSPNEKLLLSVDMEGTIALWDSKTFEVIKTIETGEFIVNASVSDEGEIMIGFAALITEEFGETPIDRIRFYNRPKTCQGANADPNQNLSPNL